MEFLQQNTGVQLLVDKMFKLWSIHFNNLNRKRSNLKVDRKTSFGNDRQECLILTSASQVPRVKWHIEHFWLQVCDWPELSSFEHKLSLCSVEFKTFDVLSWPNTLFLIPNSHFRLILIGGENVWRKFEQHWNRFNLNSWLWIWVLDAFKRVFHWQDASDQPVRSSSCRLWVLVHFGQHNTTNYELVGLL